MSRNPLVCDTTLLLYLDRIGQTGLLSALFEPICLPEPVRSELDAGRMMRSDTIDAMRLAWATMVSVDQDDNDDLPTNRLGDGERAVIAYARFHPGYWVGLDDRQARVLAERLGLRVIGILGVLLRAKNAGLILTVLPLLDELQRVGFRLGPEVRQAALQLAGEASSSF